jgi:hypothetical protein
MIRPVLIEFFNTLFSFQCPLLMDIETVGEGVKNSDKDLWRAFKSTA